MFKKWWIWGCPKPIQHHPTIPLEWRMQMVGYNHLYKWVAIWPYVAILNCQRVAGKYLFVCSHHAATKNKQKIPTETQAGVRIGVQEGEQAHAIMRFKTWRRSWIKGPKNMKNGRTYHQKWPKSTVTSAKICSCCRQITQSCEICRHSGVLADMGHCQPFLGLQGCPGCSLTA